ncbi:hypothetical protein KF913_07510 [Candidatus Obscuribacterales bacterium]|nr:hypothetical protein [Candidatus Obscuribacterales bacterium]
MQNVHLNEKRRAHGNAIAEMPGVLMVLFFMFVFPIINLGTTGLRWAMLAEAARDGAHAAATSYTFQTGSTGKPSAVAAAPVAVNQFVSKYSGITVNNIDVDILATDINTQAVSRFENKLTTPANTQQYIYAMETTVTGSLEPLITYNAPFILSVPGLTGPWTTTITAREFAESPQGLNE